MSAESLILLVELSDKAMGFTKKSIKYYTRREMNPMPIDGLVDKLNKTAQGWSNYFLHGHGHRKLKQVRHYMEENLRLHLRYGHKLNSRGMPYTRFPR